MKRFPCPCCGFLTRSQASYGTHEICPVCYWEDDRVQYQDPEFQGGANDVSLNQGKVNYIRIGAIDENARQFVRKPIKIEKP